MASDAGTVLSWRGAAGLSVVVVGAGIGGLTAALLLSRIGAAVTVLERERQPDELGAGLLLQPNGLAVLDGLGLTSQVASLGRRSFRADIRNANERLLSGQTFPDLGEGFDSCVGILRQDLHRVLLAAIRTEPSIELRAGAKVCAAGPDGVVEIEPGVQLAPADVVVGADGVGSGVRSRGNFGARVSDRRTVYVRGLVPADGSETFVEYWTSLGAFGSAPVAAGVTYFYLGGYRRGPAEAVAGHDLVSLRESWRRALPAAGAVLDRVASFDDLIISGVRSVRCRTWVDGRLVLLGDAAHAMAPNAGQGANSAMVDAVALASELAAASSVTAGLRGYEVRRRPAVGRVQRVADVLAVVSGLHDGPLAVGRDIALRTANRVPGVTHRQWRSAQQEHPLAICACIRRMRRPQDEGRSGPAGATPLLP
jgi:2-polyprenyl-6-methoxyphenol hydroxylase-like FAD-dependent oxidoreductase